MHHDGSPEYAAILPALGGRYQIVREIGAGAMGVVFLARDTRLHRMVAIKVLRLELAADPARSDAFLREARLTAHLQHPGVVPVYDVIESDNAVAVVMAFGGNSLASHLVDRGGTLPVAEVCGIMLDITSTLAFVHTSGVLHRDLKPENVLLEPGYGRLHARLTDFGIALTPLRDHGMTGQGVPAGTPGFASPEQIFSIVDTDRRSDIYALGVLAYRLLAGRLPFSHATRLEARRQQFTPLRVAAPHVPRDLARIVERCLAIDPTDRWPSAASLHEQLERYARTLHAPPAARSDAPPLTSSSFFRRALASASAVSSFTQIIGEAWRSLRRAPAFSALVIGTLALGIGANATMLAVLDELVFRPPRHVVHPEGLYTPALTVTRRENTYTNTVHSYPVFTALAGDTSVFAGAAMFTSAEMSLGTGGDARPVSAMAVSGEYFRVLGTQAARGRLLLPEDDAPPSGAPVVVISDAFWKTQFGARADAVGQVLTINNARYTVVGVAPRGFAGTRAEAADLWLPISASPLVMVSYPAWRTNFSIWMGIVTRLRAGVSPAQAAASATVAVRAAHPAGRPEATTAVVALAPAMPRLDATLEPESKVAVLLAAVSIFVLLTACANVANITLARNIRRAGDLAIRQVLGVTRQRLAALLMTEALILAATGGACALAIMYVGGPVLLHALQTGTGSSLVLDVRSALIALGVSALAAVAAGLVPALSVKEDLGAAVRTASRSLTRRNRAARYALLGFQCASCAALLAGSGLFVRSLHNVDTLDMGFSPDGLWSARVDLSRAGLGAERTAAIMRDLGERAARIPGVTNVAIANNMPLSYWGNAVRVRVPGRVDSLPVFKDGGPYYTSVGADYFTTIGARITRGRAFTSDDRGGRPPVVMINESIARKWYPGTDPVGSCLEVGNTQCATIVGVVADVRRQKLVEDYGSGMIYIPIEQQPADFSGALLLARVRSGANPTRALRQLLQTAAPGLPYATVTPLQANIDARATSWRLGRALFTMFGVLALLIASVGIYGVFSFAVAQRKREIGIRIALGAASNRVLGMVLGEGVMVGIAGATAGIAAVAASSSLLAPLLFRTNPVDTLVLSAAFGAVVVIALLACLLPARRATRVEPMIAIRAE
ncbi:MAG TPA: ADOP family duplicated permease [Gemmatimonadaceae bacterium]|nr:ADOP family duplicated permease [Gemmatimonadaceae bacterium]